MGCATDRVIESFRNDLYPGYKSLGGDAARPARAVPDRGAGRSRRSASSLWPMVEWEADDALAAATDRFVDAPGVDRIVICTVDKDLAQCVARRPGGPVGPAPGHLLRRGRRPREVGRRPGEHPGLPRARRRFLGRLSGHPRVRVEDGGGAAGEVPPLRGRAGQGLGVGRGRASATPSGWRRSSWSGSARRCSIAIWRDCARRPTGCRSPRRDPDELRWAGRRPGGVGGALRRAGARPAARPAASLAPAWLERQRERPAPRATRALGAAVHAERRCTVVPRVVTCLRERRPSPPARDLRAQQVGRVRARCRGRSRRKTRHVTEPSRVPLFVTVRVTTRFGGLPSDGRDAPVERPDAGQRHPAEHRQHDHRDRDADEHGPVRLGCRGLRAARADCSGRTSRRRPGRAGRSGRSRASGRWSGRRARQGRRPSWTCVNGATQRRIVPSARRARRRRRLREAARSRPPAPTSIIVLDRPLELLQRQVRLLGRRLLGQDVADGEDRRPRGRRSPARRRACGEEVQRRRLHLEREDAPRSPFRDVVRRRGCRRRRPSRPGPTWWRTPARRRRVDEAADQARKSAVGAYGSPCRYVARRAVERRRRRRRSRGRRSGCRGRSRRTCPTRISRRAPRRSSSSTTIERLGVPMPVVWTLTGTPRYVPV